MRVAESHSIRLPRLALNLLQWGRNMRVAESWIFVDRFDKFEVLQWGRNMRVAERLKSLVVTTCSNNFNGAAT